MGLETVGHQKHYWLRAVADCFILSFRDIARASKLSWLSLECDVEGALTRIEGTARFHEFQNKSHTSCAPGYE